MVPCPGACFPRSKDTLVSTVDEAAEPTAHEGRSLRILLLADDRHSADVVRDHINAIQRHSRHRIEILNPIWHRKGWAIDTCRYDAIAIHYSICIVSDYHLPEPIAERIRGFPGPKIQIIQDEYRWIDRMTGVMADLGIGAVFSSLVPENIRKVYHHPHLSGVWFYSGLPGYVPDRWRDLSVPPVAARPFHLVYRGRPLPVWLGKFAQEKSLIADHGERMAERYGLTTDIKAREEDRIYGKAWQRFLQSGRAILATEGGATVFDFDEAIERHAVAYRVEHPGASQDDVWEAVVRPYDGNIVHKTLTPRVLEAVMCRTALVMYPGHFRGYLEPWEHYIPLERDGSNEAVVAEKIKDDDFIEGIVTRAYAHIANAPTLRFSHYVKAIDETTCKLASAVWRNRELSARAQARAVALSGIAIPIRAVDRFFSNFEIPHSRSARIVYFLMAHINTCVFVFRQIPYMLRRAFSVFRTQMLRRLARVLVAGIHDCRHAWGTVTRPARRRPSPRVSSFDRVAEPKLDVLSVLVLCDFWPRRIGTVRDHLNAFRIHSKHNVCLVDPRTVVPIGLDLTAFDVIVLHYSLIISSEAYLPPPVAKMISRFNGYKVLFIQDEYRWVDRTVAAIAELGIDVMYSVVNTGVMDQVYNHESISHVRKKTTLTGFVPEELTKLPVPDYNERPTDVGYRARRLPAWLGSFGQEKWKIGERFRSEAGQYGLVCDIESDEDKRLYGRKWIRFICSCKAVLGTESGASFVDFAGDVQPVVENFALANPEADFAEIRDRFLGEKDGEVVIRVISPRCFEAAALRTLMILYPGRYSGILEPWRHYVPLSKDHSNMDEVAAILRDEKRASEIIENAYREVALNPAFSYQAMVEEFDRDLDTHAKGKSAVVANRQATAASLNPFVTLRSERAFRRIERRSERAYLWRTWSTGWIKHRIFLLVHWSIRRLVPARYQPMVRHYLKTVAIKARLWRGN